VDWSKAILEHCWVNMTAASIRAYARERCYDFLLCGTCGDMKKGTQRRCRARNPRLEIQRTGLVKLAHNVNAIHVKIRPYMQIKNSQSAIHA
jgi:hypothetical protein